MSQNKYTLTELNEKKLVLKKELQKEVKTMTPNWKLSYSRQHHVLTLKNVHNSKTAINIEKESSWNEPTQFHVKGKNLTSHMKREGDDLLPTLVHVLSRYLAFEREIDDTKIYTIHLATAGPLRNLGERVEEFKEAFLQLGFVENGSFNGVRLVEKRNLDFYNKVKEEVGKVESYFRKIQYDKDSSVTWFNCNTPMHQNIIMEVREIIDKKINIKMDYVNQKTGLVFSSKAHIKEIEDVPFSFELFMDEYDVFEKEEKLHSMLVDEPIMNEAIEKRLSKIKDATFNGLKVKTLFSHLITRYSVEDMNTFIRERQGWREKDNYKFDMSNTLSEMDGAYGNAKEYKTIKSKIVYLWGEDYILVNLLTNRAHSSYDSEETLSFTVGDDLEGLKKQAKAFLIQHL